MIILFIKKLVREAFKKSMKISIFFKTHPLQPPSMEKNKNNMVQQSFLSKNKHLGEYKFFPLKKKSKILRKKSV